jgi:tetratricopeptide (TPR) repeat protein
LVAAAAAIICYLNVLPNNFCYDDDPIVRFNEKVNDPEHWLTIWTTDYWSHTQTGSPNRDLLYRPIALTSYRLVRTVAGPHPLPQHLVNVLLHALVAALLVRLCRRMGLSEAISFAAGVLFAVLPIHSEVVAGVVGRADVLATLGVLLALLAHRRSLVAASPSTTACWRIVAAFAAFGAMGAKENGVSVIPLVVVWDAFQTRSRRASDGSPNWWGWSTLRRLMYILAPAAVYFGLRYFALDGHFYQRPALTKTVNVLVDAPLWQHTLGVLQLWGMYWAKTFWPSLLCVNYSINSVRLATSLLDPHVVMGTLTTVALIIGAVAGWRKNAPTIALLAAAIAVSYAPTANVFVLMQVFFAERVWYLPSVWATVLIAMIVAPLLQMRIWRTVGIILLFALTARCWIRNAEWRDNGTLYAAAYRDHPDAVGCLHLYGQWLVNNDKYADGVTLLKRAIDMDMGYTDAHRTLGQAHFHAGNWREAVRHLQIADMQVPGHPPTTAALEQASRELSLREGERLSRLAQTAADRPEDVVAEVEMIRKMRELGRVRDALDRFQASESRFSASALWQSEYAVTLVYLNDLDGAIARYLQAIELAPDDPQRMVELAMLLLERRQENDLDQAWELATRASRLAPGAPFVLICRAELLALRGDLQGAVAAYQEAIRALPPGSDQRRVLEERARALGR